MTAADLDAVPGLVAGLLADHGLAAAGWQFRWTDRRSVLGLCDFRARTVEVSRPLAAVNSADVLLDTVGHEVAHALAGVEAGHGPAWQVWAVRLGATPRAKVRAAGVWRWQGTCADCGATFGRNRRTTGVHHGPCAGKPHGGAIEWARADEEVPS